MPLLLGGQGILEDAFTPPRPEDKRKLKNPLTTHLVGFSVKRM